MKNINRYLNSNLENQLWYPENAKLHRQLIIQLEKNFRAKLWVEKHEQLWSQLRKELITKRIK